MTDPLVAVIRRGIELFRPAGAETVCCSDRQPSQTNDHWAFCWVPPLHHFQQGREPGDASYNEEMARDSAFSNPRACAGMAEAFGIDEVACHLADIRSCSLGRTVATERRDERGRGLGEHRRRGGSYRREYRRAGGLVL